MKIDLDKIEAAARAATLWPCCDLDTGKQDQWCLDETGALDPLHPHMIEMPWSEVLDCDLLDDCEPTTRAFLEASSPVTVLALVQRVRELEQHIERTEPVYLAAKALHQLSDIIDDGEEPLMAKPPLVRRLVEALNASYGDPLCGDEP